MKEYKQIRCGSLHLEVVIGSFLVKAVKPIRCGSLHLEAIIGSLPVKAVKTIRSLYFRSSWPNEIPPV